MVVKNGKAPARRKLASSSAKSKRSNTLSKSGVYSHDIASTNELDGDINRIEAATLESETGDRILEETGIDGRASGDAVSTESVELTAITLHQPWASLIAAGKKQYETRSWGTDYRGLIAIHAAKKQNACRPELLKLLGVQSIDNLPAGSIVAIAQLTDCIKMGDAFIDLQSDIELDCGDWEEGRYAWKLENVRAIEPIAATGKQGLWKYSWNSAESTQLKVGDRLVNQTEFATVSIITGKDAYLKRDSGGSICLPVSELKSFGWELSNSWNPADFGEAEYKSDADGQLNFLDVNEPPEPDDYASIELFDAAYEQWEKLQCNTLMDGSIFAAESVPASPLPESNCGEGSPINSVKETATVGTFSSLDTLHQTEFLQMSTTLTMTEKQTSLLPAPPANPFQLTESDSHQLMIATAFQQSLQQSEITSPNLPLSKTSWASSTAHIPPATNQEAILPTSSTPYRQVGTMRNGFVSGVMNSPLRGVDKDYLLLRSPGALSSTGAKSPPGKTRLESQLQELNLISAQEVAAPEFLESGYQLPVGFTNLQENRTALELAQAQPQALQPQALQQSIDLKSELRQETAITAIDAQPSAMHSTGELQPLDSSELNISVSLPSNMGALTKTELLSMAQEQHQLICVIERKQSELALEKLHRAYLTGICLMEFKKKCRYGEFVEQLESSGIGERSAQGYMTVAKNWEVIEAKAKLVALLPENNEAPSLGIKWALETVRDEKKQLKSAAPPKDPDGWRTPNTKDQPVVDLVKQSLGGIIWVDPCSDPSAKVPASVRYFKDDDGLAECNAWTRTVFANPPFSDPLPWVKRCCFEIARGTVSAAVMLLKAGVVSNVGTGELISKYASAVCHWRGRINFLNDEGYAVKGSDFDCVLVYFGDRLDLFRKAFAGRGTISTIDNHYSSVNKKYQLESESFATVAAEERQMAAAVGLRNGRSLLPDMRDADRDLMERHDPSTVFENMPTVFTSIEQPKISTEIQSISAEFQQASLNDYITAISSNISAFSDEQIAFLAKIINEESAKRVDF